MGAIVTSDEDEDWDTNSRAWQIILDRAMRDLDRAERAEYEEHTFPVGIDFQYIEPERRPAVARWLLAAVEALCGPEGVEHGWDGEASRTHLGELAAMLRRIAQK